MPPPADLTVLVPVDVSDPDPPSLGVLDHLGAAEVVLLGYFPVPDQAEPALIKDEFEAEATARLDDVASGHEVTDEVLVFTHDRGTTVDRVADQYECDAVLTARDAPAVERILVPVRGDVNLERIVAVVAGLLEATDATATLFHAVAEDADPSQAEFMLAGVLDRFVDLGIDRDRVDWQLGTRGDAPADIVERGEEYDLVVLGETEPSLRERVMGDVLARIVDELRPPALVVRDIG